MFHENEQQFVTRITSCWDCTLDQFEQNPNHHSQAESARYVISRLTPVILQLLEHIFQRCFFLEEEYFQVHCFWIQYFEWHKKKTWSCKRTFCFAAEKGAKYNCIGAHCGSGLMRPLVCFPIIDVTPPPLVKCSPLVIPPAVHSSSKVLSLFSQISIFLCCQTEIRCSKQQTCNKFVESRFSFLLPKVRI